jgi:hypothetical protein
VRVDIEVPGRRQEPRHGRTLTAVVELRCGCRAMVDVRCPLRVFLVVRPLLLRRLGSISGWARAMERFRWHIGDEDAREGKWRGWQQ